VRPQKNAINLQREVAASPGGPGRIQSERRAPSHEQTFEAKRVLLLSRSTGNGWQP